MKIFKIVALAVVMLVLILPATGAKAQTSRLYFAGYLGLNTFGDQEFKESTTGRDGDLQLDNAPAYAGALGIRLTRDLRFEGEYNYSNASYSRVSIADSGDFDINGEQQSKIILANLYYDLDVPWAVKPYVGGGIGYGWFDGEVDDTASTLLSSSSGDDAGFAWNVAAGVKYRTRDDLAFTLGYRYLDTLDLDLGNYTVDYDSHELRLGLEWDLPLYAR